MEISHILNNEFYLIKNVIYLAHILFLYEVIMKILSKKEADAIRIDEN